MNFLDTLNKNKLKSKKKIEEPKGEIPFQYPIGKIYIRKSLIKETT